MSEVRPRPRPPDRGTDPNAPIPYRAAEGLQTTTSKGQGGTPAHFVRSRRGEMVQLGEEEFLLFTLIDGQPSFTDIQREFKARFAGDLSRRHFQAFIDELLAAGIIERIPAEPSPGEGSEPGSGPISASVSASGSAPGSALGSSLGSGAEPGSGAAGFGAPPADMRAPEPAAAALRAAAADDAADLAPSSLPGAGFSLRPAFLLFARLGAPLRFFLWVLVPAVLAAGIVLYDTADVLAARLGSIAWNSGLAPLHDAAMRFAIALRAADWTGLRDLMTDDAGRAALLPPGAAGILADGLAALAACWLIPRIAQGAVAAYHGAPGAMFRLRVSGRVIPRFPVDRAGIATLSRKGRACCHAAPLLTLLALLVAGAALGALDDPRGGRVAVGGLLLAWCAGICFLAAATPLWHGHGRRWMDSYLGETPGPDSAPKGRGGFVVAAGAIAVAAGIGAALLWIGPTASPASRQIAAWLLGGAFAACLIWLFAARIVADPLRDATGRLAATRNAAILGAMAGGPPSLDDRLFGGGEAWPSNRRAVIYAILFAILVCIAFLPYPYESGGAFNVLPNDRYALLARVSGEITEVLVREGEWVQEGQVVATLADWVEVHNLATSQAQLEQSMANLQNLLISPKPEEVEVARKQYEQAASRLPYSKGDYERKLALVKTSDIPVSQFELSQSTYEQDQAAVAVTKANYDFVRVGPTQAQIAAARAGVHLATELVAYNKDQLDRTRIRATASGQVVTPDPQLMMGQFLAEGAVFVALEDHRVAHVEVQVPETDIRDIHLGSLVRAKAWGYEHTIWLGKTILIAPDAQPNALVGNVVRVVAEIPNEGGLLRPTMSGDAKVETVDMPVWVSFTRALMRFLLIEVWYWIP